MVFLRRQSLAGVCVFLWTLCACNVTPLPAYSPDDTSSFLSEEVPAPSPQHAPSTDTARHFSVGATRTGNNATIIIPTSAALRIGGATLEVGDEIAIFTLSGRCAGTTVWKGENASLTLWGDDPITSEVDGMQPDEPMEFRIWDASERAEYGGTGEPVRVTFAANRPYLQTKPRYYPDGIYVVETLTANPSGK